MQMFKSFEYIDTFRCKCLNHLNTLIPRDAKHMQMFKSFEHIDTFRCKCLNHLNTLIPRDANVLVS